MRALAKTQPIPVKHKAKLTIFIDKDLNTNKICIFTMLHPEREYCRNPGLSILVYKENQETFILSFELVEKLISTGQLPLHYICICSDSRPNTRVPIESSRNPWALVPTFFGRFFRQQEGRIEPLRSFSSGWRYRSKSWISTVPWFCIVCGVPKGSTDFVGSC
ncbi:hypothetical protein ACFFRR_009306 [Megaselia abdita]